LARSEDLQSGKVKWQSPSNIALVKYWGKHGNQLPQNPSLSMTLHRSCTTTQIEYEVKNINDGPSLEFYFEGKPAVNFEKRILTFLNSRTQQFPFLKQLHLKINSSNTFPHSSGIASSASAFSALSLCVLSIQEMVNGQKTNTPDFYQQASELARLGSGSAGRSVYGGYVVWGAHTNFPLYNDQFAVPVTVPVHPVFQNYHDAILIVSGEKKKKGSSAGHALMEDNPFASARYKQAKTNLVLLHKVLETGDLEQFIQIVENEALSLHGLMLSSNPGYLLMKGRTIRIIQRIREFRKLENIPVCFTLDAGPNVHLLYPEKDRSAVLKWIKDELLGLCDHNRWIDDKTGEGPERIV